MVKFTCPNNSVDSLLWIVRRATCALNESICGLAPGAPLELRGIKVVEVVGIRAQVDTKGLKFSAPVIIGLDAPAARRHVLWSQVRLGFHGDAPQSIDSLMSDGVRAQLRAGSLLTGLALVAFDFFPSSSPAAVEWSQNPPQPPITPGQLEAVKAGLGDIVKKLGKMPLQQIGNNLQRSMAELDLTLRSARGPLRSLNTTLWQGEQYP
jgi:paraquat-inducible protein B